MNANELADELDRLHEKLYLHWDEDSPRLQNAATMLRQQQAELDRAVELYTDKAIENEALKMMLANRNDALDRLDLK